MRLRGLRGVRAAQQNGVERGWTGDAAVFAGGIIGSFLGPGLRQDFKENLNMILGVCSMTIGGSAIVLMKNMPAVIFATILGTVIGLAIHLGDKIHAAGRGMQRMVL